MVGGYVGWRPLRRRQRAAHCAQQHITTAFVVSPERTFAFVTRQPPTDARGGWAERRAEGGAVGCEWDTHTEEDRLRACVPRGRQRSPPSGDRRETAAYAADYRLRLRSLPLETERRTGPATKPAGPEGGRRRRCSELRGPEASRARERGRRGGRREAGGEARAKAAGAKARRAEGGARAVGGGGGGEPADARTPGPEAAEGRWGGEGRSRETVGGWEGG